MFSIIFRSFYIIVFFNFLINILKKNSKFANEIIIHVNIGKDGTIEYLKENNINMLNM